MRYELIFAKTARWWLAFIVSSVAHASGPIGSSIQGTLYSPNGTPVTSLDVDFTIQVYDKSKSCVLYEETHIGVDLSTTKGAFSLELGTGDTRSNKVDRSTTLTANVFRNDVSPVSVVGCSPDVNFASSDERYIRVTFVIDASTNVAVGPIILEPDLKIGTSPYASIAASLNGKSDTDFVHIRDDASVLLTQSNLEFAFSATNYPRLQSLLTSGQTLTNIGAPNYPSDAVNKDYADSRLAGKSIDLTGVSDGKVLTWANNQWVAATPSSSGITALTGDVTASGSGSVVASIATNAVTKMKIADGAISSAKIEADTNKLGVNRLVISDATTGSTLSFATCPNPNETLKWTTNGWECATVSSLAPVVSVAGKTGVISLNAADIDNLGTAALKNTGTATGNVVMLEAQGLPAVSGEQLLNISAQKLQSRDLASTAPTSGQVLMWNGSRWEPSTPATSGGGTGNILADSGSVAAPSFAFSAEPGLGLYRSGAGVLSIAAGGSTGWNITNSSLSGAGVGAQILNSTGPSTATYRFTNDTNSGMGLPSTGNLAFTTNASERMRIDSAGNIGIGTNSPGSVLDINGDIANRGMAAPATSSAGQGRIYFDSTLGKYRVSQNGGSYVDLVSSGGSPGGGSGEIQFNNSGSFGGSNTFTWSNEQLKIGQAGGPDQSWPLNVIGNGSSATISIGKFSFTPAAGDYTAFSFRMNDSIGMTTERSAIRSYTEDVNNGSFASSLRFLTSSSGTVSERMRIDPLGNIGIGTSNPGARLEISSGAAGTSGLKFTNFNSSSATATGQAVGVDANGYLVTIAGSTGVTYPLSGTLGSAAAPTYSFAGDTDTGWYSPSTGVIAASTNGTERVRVSSSGYLGIGTTAPITDIHAHNAGNVAVNLKLTNLTTGTSSNDGSYVAIAGNGNFYIWNQEASPLSLGTNNIERLVIDANGNVGINSATPAVRFDVNGVANVKRIDSNQTDSALYTGSSASANPDGALNYFTNTSTATGTASHINWQSGTTQRAYMGIVRSASGNTPSIVIGQQTAASQTTERMRIDASGNVGIGTSTPGGKLHVAGTLVLDDGASNVGRINSYGGLELYSTVSGSGKLAQFTQGAGNSLPNYLSFINNNPGFSPSLTVDGSDASIDLKIYPKGTGSVLFTSGKVGIGTTNAASLLHVNGLMRVADICDETGANCKDISSGWGAGGSVTSVVAGTGLTGGTITAAGTLNVDVGTAANKIVQLDASARIPAVDGGLLNNINASRLQGRAIASSTPTASQVLGWNATNSQWEPTSLAPGSSGDFKAIDGSASNPAISFASDPTVGLFRPASKTMAIATNSTERLRVDSNGNIGIGTVSPGAKLEIASGTVNTSGLKFTNFTSAAPTSTGTAVGVDSSGNLVTIASPGVTYPLAGSLGSANAPTYSFSGDTDTGWFSPGAGILAASSNAVERLRVDSSGYVGIGTTTPGAHLEVAGLWNSSGTVFTGIRTNFNVQWAAAGSKLLDLQNQSSSRFSVDPSGNVITTGGLSISPTWDNPSAVYEGIVENANVSWADNASSLMNLKMNGTSRFYVNMWGNVGIGTTSPAAKLEVSSGVANTSGLKFTNFSSTTPTSSGTAVGVDASGNLVTVAGSSQWTTSGADIYYNAGSGRVGIGTNAPTFTLDMNLVGSAGNMRIGSSSGNQAYVAYAINSTNKGFVGLANNGTSIMTSGITNSDLVMRSVGQKLHLSATGTPNLTVDTSGNIGIGTTTPGAPLDVNGKIAASGKVVIYNADATYTGSIFYGDGGTALSHTSGIQGYYNVGVGLGALYANTTGGANSANGYQALNANTTGAGNVANGYQALFSNTTGFATTANGAQALYSNTTGNYNTANGNMALYSNTTGAANTANGTMSLYSNTSGTYNIANGWNALYANTGGQSNVANGAWALSQNTTGNYNTANGHMALYSNITGSNNIAAGHQAGAYIANGSTANSATGNSVYLGALTKALTASGTNEIVIGYSATGLGSNSVVLGNDSITITALKGNVGIGTTSPTNALDVGTGGGIRIANGTPGSTSEALYNNSGTLMWNGSAVSTGSGGGGSGSWLIKSADYTMSAGDMVYLESGNTADAFYSSNVLALHFDGSNGSATFTDQTGKTVTPVGGSMRISTTQSKFGGASGVFSNGNYLTLNYSSALSMNSQDFTVETWIYPTAYPGSNGAVILDNGSWWGSNQTNYELGMNSIGQVWVAVGQSSTSTVNAGVGSQSSVALNTWAHIAAVKQGSLVTLYLNGVAQGSMYLTFTPNNGSTNNRGLYIGTLPGNTGGYYFTGHIDDLRITSGVARYKNNFVPAVTAFSDSAAVVPNLSLPASPAAGASVRIRTGDSLATVLGNGNTIAGASSFSLGAGLDIIFIFDGTVWRF